MSDANINPLKEAGADLQKYGGRLKHWVIDRFRRYGTATLLKVTLPSLGAAGLAVIELPLFVGMAAAVAIIALVAYAVYATRLMKRLEASYRWAWISNNRLELENLKLQDAGDRMVLAVVGEAQDRRQVTRLRPLELRSALGYLRSKYITEMSQQQFPRSAVCRQQSASPPDLRPVRNRIKVREAKLKEGEALVQSLAVPEIVSSRMAAEEATRSRKQIEDDALAADRAARENARQGRTASPSSPGLALQVQVSANGDRSVQHVRAPLTPEQIARGESWHTQPADDEAA
jgi:hypothetical protein